MSERNPGRLVIPPNLYHGWKNIWTTEAFIINMPSSQYDYAGRRARPALRLAPRPGDHPFRW